MMEEILKVNNVTKRFGGLVAVNNVSFDVSNGEILGIIGPNGSGKTTLFNVISGFYPLTSGKVFYKGEDITKLGLHETSRRGIVRTFQGTEIFKDLSVIQNIKSYGYSKIKKRLLYKYFSARLGGELEENLEKDANEIIKLVDLCEWREVISKNLPFGFQRLLGIAIALSAEPELLMLDEPTTGMNPAEKENFMNLIKRVREVNNITIIIVEHDMKVMMNTAERIVVFSNGQKIAEGIPEDIRQNKKVIDVYLGAEIENN